MKPTRICTATSFRQASIKLLKIYQHLRKYLSSTITYYAENFTITGQSHKRSNPTRKKPALNFLKEKAFPMINDAKSLTFTLNNVSTPLA